MSRPHIEIDIQELVLQGVAPADRNSIADAVEVELARLLAQHGLPPPLDRGASIAQIDAGSVRVRAASQPTLLGIQIAKSVYKGLRS